MQNWQSNYNKFLSDKIELEKEVDLEKSKIESYLENIAHLEKRLDKQRNPHQKQIIVTMGQSY